MTRKIITLVLAALVVAGCASPSINTDPGEVDPNVSSSFATLDPEGDLGTATQPVDSPPPAPAAQASVGDSLTVSAGFDETTQTTLKVTLLKVQQTARPADEFSVPADGNRYAAARLRITNTGARPYVDSPSNGAVMGDAEGQRFSATFGDTKAGPSMSSDVKLAPGASVVGWLTFEVPKSSKIVLVQWGADSGFGDETAEWTLS